jgi:hypothetical protein
MIKIIVHIKGVSEPYSYKTLMGLKEVYYYWRHHAKLTGNVIELPDNGIRITSHGAERIEKHD